MTHLNCDICTKEFYKKPSHVTENNYCSIKCAAEGRKNGKEVPCFQCGAMVYRTQQYLLQNTRHFCSKRCNLEWINSYFVKERHPNWKDGTGGNAYRFALKEDRNPVCRMCGVDNEIMLVAHHIDMNRANNKLSNLCWLCRNCHHLVHHYPQENTRLDKILSTS